MGTTENRTRIESKETDPGLYRAFNWGEAVRVTSGDRCLQTGWQPEFNLQVPEDGKRNLPQVTSDLHMCATVCTYPYAHINK